MKILLLFTLMVPLVLAFMEFPDILIPTESLFAIDNVSALYTLGSLAAVGGIAFALGLTSHTTAPLFKGLGDQLKPPEPQPSGHPPIVSHYSLEDFHAPQPVSYQQYYAPISNEVSWFDKLRQKFGHRRRIGRSALNNLSYEIGDLLKAALRQDINKCGRSLICELAKNRDAKLPPHAANLRKFLRGQTSITLGGRNPKEEASYQTFQRALRAGMAGKDCGALYKTCSIAPQQLFQKFLTMKPKP